MNPYRSTSIAIDFDRTFTSDVDMWRTVIRMFAQRGHKVYCITGRTETPYSRAELYNTFGPTTFSLLARCIFCNHLPKREITRQLGIHIDIWIDDLPEGIGGFTAAQIARIAGNNDVCETLPIFVPKGVNPDSCWTPVLEIPRR